MSVASTAGRPGLTSGFPVRRPSRAARRRALPGRAVVAGSVIAWIVVLAVFLAPALTRGPAHQHGAPVTGSTTPAAAPMDALTWPWIGGWMLMVAAMMWPLLVPTVDHVSRAAFPRWRWILVAITVLISTLLWVGLGLAVALVAQVAGVPHGSVWWQLAFIGVAAVAWRSAARSRLLWRCTVLPPLAPGGRRGMVSAAAAGVVSWRQCALLCGPLMIAMVVSHNPVVMIAASLSVWWEAWHPRAWRDRVPLALIVVAAIGAIAGGLLT